MARTRTLAQLRTEALQIADMENSSFVGTALGGEVDRYLNEGISELYDLIVESAGQEWFLLSSTLNIVSGTQTYALPSDMYILKGMDLDTTAGGTPVPLRPYMFDERHLNNIAGWGTTRGWAYDLVRYRTYGEVNATTGAYTPRVRFTPEPTGSHTVTVWYIPHAPVLDADTDVWDGFNGWEEYPVIYAGIRMLEKEESDATHLHVRLERLKQRIQSLAGARDQGYPERVQDLDDIWTW